MGDYYQGFFTACVLCGLFFILAFKIHGVKLKSNERIEPSFTVTIEDGKSDTLFIYKKD